MWFGIRFYSIYIRFFRLVMVGTMIPFFNLNTFTFGCSYRIIWFSNGKGYKNEHLYENHGWEIFQDEAHFWKKIEYYIKLIFEIQNDKMFRYMLVLAKDRYHLIANKLKLVKKVNIPITYITIISPPKKLGTNKLNAK